jgi:hypothetical protein
MAEIAQAFVRALPENTPTELKKAVGMVGIDDVDIGYDMIEVGNEEKIMTFGTYHAEVQCSKSAGAIRRSPRGRSTVMVEAPDGTVTIMRIMVRGLPSYFARNQNHNHTHTHTHTHTHRDTHTHKFLPSELCSIFQLVQCDKGFLDSKLSLKPKKLLSHGTSHADTVPILL